MRFTALLTVALLSLSTSIAFAQCVGSTGPGGACSTGPGGGLSSGPGGGLSYGPGGGCSSGPGGNSSDPWNRPNPNCR